MSASRRRPPARPPVRSPVRLHAPRAETHALSLRVLTAPGRNRAPDRAQYFAGALDALSSGIEAEAISTVSVQISSDQYAVIFSSLALAAMYVFVYRPLIAFLDLEIKRSHYLLLLVPEEIAKVVPALVSAGQKLAVLAQEA